MDHKFECKAKTLKLPGKKNRRLSWRPWGVSHSLEENTCTR